MVVMSFLSLPLALHILGWPRQVLRWWELPPLMLVRRQGPSKVCRMVPLQGVNSPAPRDYLTPLGRCWYGFVCVYYVCIVEDVYVHILVCTM